MNSKQQQSSTTQPMADRATVREFLDALASADPTPGGGGSAALIGATGAALVSMVCRLTIGKKGYEAVGPAMQALLDESEALRARMTAMIDTDAQAFDALMAAYRLPRDGDEAAIAARAATIQQALRGATEAPLDCARAACELVRQAHRAAQQGNRNVLSDAGVAAHAGMAALYAAALNVQINVPQIGDSSFVERVERELDELFAQGRQAMIDVNAHLKA